ncbi:RloB family protein [Prevotella nigrescens]|jgi:hypothetical protein|uniref:RloB family protein n=1 Tax=Prevotella nigrescens TaxID=28133 RepID=UPI0028D63DC3|nr:RloB family protein [Prevotella nigrescens]
MGKLRNRAIIIGEGITEFYYFQSLRDVYKQVVFKPDCPKHTSIRELERKIREAAEKGYTHIFCIIDMDTKNKEPERTQYEKLKAKFAKPINKPKKGIYCKVEFFETHLCTEMFFRYYFGYTSRSYGDQESLIKDLNKYVEYEKTIDFFSKSKGLHSYFERNGGSLKKAIANAEKSMKEKEKNDRDYTYSELGQLMKALGGFTK